MTNPDVKIVSEEVLLQRVWNNNEATASQMELDDRRTEKLIKSIEKLNKTTTRYSRILALLTLTILILTIVLVYDLPTIT